MTPKTPQWAMDEAADVVVKIWACCGPVVISKDMEEQIAEKIAKVRTDALEESLEGLRYAYRVVFDCKNEECAPSNSERDKMAAFLVAIERELDKHSSDCALHNGPAELPKPCDCGTQPGLTPDEYGSEFPKEPT